MKKADFVFSLVCGLAVSFAISDVTAALHFPSMYLYFVVSLAALLGVWIASLIGNTVPVVYQAAKHLLVGAFATVVDLKIFEFLLWILGFIIHPVIVKGISFIFSTFIKYWGNKYWAFDKQEQSGLRKEMGQFFLVTLVGLLLDVSVFYYCTTMLGAQFGLSTVLWSKVSVITAAAAAAAWNFAGYKFLVFKK